MSNYSKKERAIANFLHRYPFIKKIAKKIYSRLSYLKHKKSYKVKTLFEYEAVLQSNNTTFFGYYDKSPTNKIGYTIVLESTLDSKKLPSNDDYVEINILDESSTVIYKARSNSFNWQQGCRAHWIDNDLFIFNDFDSMSSRYVSCVHSVSKRAQIATYNLPVQDSFQFDYFLSINYQRLSSLRPDYGYANLPPLNLIELSEIENDGLWKIDMLTGDSELIVSIADICKVNNKLEFDTSTHKLNHVLISPNGKKVILTHRYKTSKGRYDRLILIDLLENEIIVLSDFGMVSHCFWIDDENIIGYLKGQNNIDNYWIININDLSFTPFCQKKLSNFGDGHPHINGNRLVTDSYPDKSRLQTLLLCDLVTQDVTVLGEFFHKFEFYGPTRCDLHPRFSSNGKFIFFDSIHSGTRCLYKIKVPTQ